MDIERRSMVAELRLLDGAETKAPVMSGYAAVYNSLSSEIGPSAKRFRERIMPGAFRAALTVGNEVFAYFNHGMAGGVPHAAMPLASTHDGSLRLREDAHGLAFEFDVPETSDGKDLAVLAKRGTVRGVSFAMGAVRDTWHREGSGLIRTIHEIGLLGDVSPTHKPAYSDTVLAVRSLEQWEGEMRATNGAGEASFEDRQAAVEAALIRALGPPWGETQKEPWFVVASFPSSVVVRRSGKFSEFPVEMRAGAVELGEPREVEQVFRPAADAAAESRRRRTRLAELA